MKFAIISFLNQLFYKNSSLNVSLRFDKQLMDIFKHFNLFLEKC